MSGRNGLVAFLFMIASKANGRCTFTTKMTPESEPWYSQVRWAALYGGSTAYAASATLLLAFNFKLEFIKEGPQPLPAYHTSKSPSKPLRPHGKRCRAPFAVGIIVSCTTCKVKWISLAQSVCQRASRKRGQATRRSDGFLRR